MAEYASADSGGNGFGVAMEFAFTNRSLIGDVIRGIEPISEGPSLHGLRGEPVPPKPVYNPERPGIADMNSLSGTAKEIVLTATALRETIKRQETEKDALLEKFKEFSNTYKTFQDSWNSLSHILYTVIPDSATMPDFVQLLRTKFEPELMKLKKEFDMTLDGKVAALRADLEYNYQTRAELSKFIVEGLELIKKPGKDIDTKTCSVCYDQPITSVLVPCGHTFCSGCADRLTNCAMCNGAVEKKVRMFL